MQRKPKKQPTRKSGPKSEVPYRKGAPKRVGLSKHSAPPSPARPDGKPKPVDQKTEEKMHSLYELKISMEEAGKEAKVLQEEIIKDLSAANRRSYSFIDPRTGHKIGFTIVQNEPLVIDEAALAKKVGAAMWKKITTRVLDRKKMDAYIASGEISATTVSNVSTTKQSAPYLRKV
jgi:hypothetical protein